VINSGCIDARLISNWNFAIVAAIQNIVFGQLGTMAVTMHEIGLSHIDVSAARSSYCGIIFFVLQVAKRLTKMSRVAQLNEDQILDLLKTVRHTYKLPEPPAPAPGSSSSSGKNSGNKLSRTQSPPTFESRPRPTDTIIESSQSFIEPADSTTNVARSVSPDGQTKKHSSSKNVVAQPTAGTDGNEDEYAVL
jgi:hypothetical protein